MSLVIANTEAKGKFITTQIFELVILLSQSQMPCCWPGLWSHHNLHWLSLIARKHLRHLDAQHWISLCYSADIAVHKTGNFTSEHHIADSSEHYITDTSEHHNGHFPPWYWIRGVHGPGLRHFSTIFNKTLLLANNVSGKPGWAFKIVTCAHLYITNSSGRYVFFFELFSCPILLHHWKTEKFPQIYLFTFPQGIFPLVHCFSMDTKCPKKKVALRAM